MMKSFKPVPTSVDILAWDNWEYGTAWETDPERWVQIDSRLFNFLSDDDKNHCAWLRGLSLDSPREVREKPYTVYSNGNSLGILEEQIDGHIIFVPWWNV